MNNTDWDETSIECGGTCGRSLQSWEECGTMCNNNDKCTLWVFNQYIEWCYNVMESPTAQTIPIKNWISGKKGCPPVITSPPPTTTTTTTTTLTTTSTSYFR